MPIHGAARWACEDDLGPRLAKAGSEARGARLRGAAPIIETNNGALDALYDRDLVLDDELRSRHVLAVGVTGAGKTTRLMQPLLFSDLEDTERSLIVLDVKVEMYPWLQRATRQLRGKDVKVLNFGSAARSLGYNPLAHERLSRAAAFEMAHALCHAAEVREGSRDSVYFINNSIRLLTALFLALSDQHGRAASIAHARELLERSPSDVARWMRARTDSEPSLASLATFIESGNMNAETVLTDAAMRLTSFLDEDLCATTSRDEVRFDALVDEPTVLLVEVGEANIEKLRAILNLFFARAFDELARRAERHASCRLPRTVALHFDEFASSIGRIPHIERRLSTARSRNIQVVAAIQSIAQLDHVYERAAPVVLAGFGTKVFLAGLERVDAEYASRLSGTMTAESVLHEEVQRDDGSRETKCITAGVSRSLLLPEEVASPRRHFALGSPSTWFLPDTPPFQAWLRPAYDHPHLAPLVRAVEHVAPQRADGALRHVPLELEGAAKADAPSPERGLAKLEEALEVSGASHAARTWWAEFKRENRERMALVTKVAHELVRRKATLAEFYRAYAESRTNNIQANLHFLDYVRLRDGAAWNARAQAS